MTTQIITVASRESPLARAQVEEVLKELQEFLPNISFSCVYQKSGGDVDRLTSLRSLGKTDFFTKEIDKMVVEGKCRIAIHSAKDLPDPLTAGISIAAITKGVDSSDSLVMRDGETIFSLPEGAVIATSSVRREEAVKTQRGDFRFVDVRGTIEERLAKLHDGTADGVVIAEAALIRLKKTHLNRVTLPGDTVELQGKLAIACRCDDEEMLALFAPLDTRVRT